MPPAVMQMACENLASNIIAALTLGDMALLGDEISWVTGMLQHRDQNGTQLQMFLQSYAQAAYRQLGADGLVVNQWFDKLLE